METQHATSVRAARETWAGGCDGFLAFSTRSDPRLPAIALPHVGPEAYDNMWQKIRSMWTFVSKHYVRDFDYFIIGGEDLYILPGNLRAYLATVGSPDQVHFLGRRFKGRGRSNYFNSGGAGYVLSRAALERLAPLLNTKQCGALAHTSMEDVMVAQCLRKALGVNISDTRDAQGRERFHPFSPGTHYNWRPPKPGKPADWYEEYNREWGIKYGRECCAPDSVSFHYIKKPAMVRHLHALLYDCGERGTPAPFSPPLGSVGASAGSPLHLPQTGAAEPSSAAARRLGVGRHARMWRASLGARRQRPSQLA